MNKEIRLIKSCWGDYGYTGYVDGKQYTEIYDTRNELLEDHEDFAKVDVILNNKDYKFILTGEISLLDSEIIDKLKEVEFTVYWNDLECYYWTYDFEINEVWFSSSQIDNNNKIITLDIFQ